jgi:hypothetical protein
MRILTSIAVLAGALYATAAQHREEGMHAEWMIL